MAKLKLFLIILIALFCLSAQAEIIRGKVIKIADGDTLTLLTDSNKKIKIRLAGIDTPERKQSFGNTAKNVLAKLVFQKEIQIEVLTKDRYGRTVGIVFLDNQNVNYELVRKGMAWAYKRYTDNELLYKLEDEAKKRRIGLWADENPIAPWDWRRGKR
jgi:micrococcal nuclease|tara:strand:- start:212 stop:685 length:474 start_codon:yes stop_codon:yes gene_type:complete